MFLLNMVWGRLNCWNWPPETLLLFSPVTHPRHFLRQLSFTALQGLVSRSLLAWNGHMVAGFCGSARRNAPNVLSHYSFLFSKFWVFFVCLFLMLMCSFVWLHRPGSHLKSPGSLTLVAPWGILDVACGIQSLDQGSFWVLFLLE